MIVLKLMNNPTIKFPRWIIAGLVVLFISLVLFIFRVPLLEKMGSSLVYQSDLVPSDAIVVLAGSKTGNRIKEAVKIYKKGIGKIIVLSGYANYPGVYSHIAMKQYAMNLGIPEDRIIAEKSVEEKSTWGEAHANLTILDHLKIKSFILVTSSFHTRRSRWVYERVIEKLQLDIAFSVQSAPDPRVPYPGWWKTKSGKQYVFEEYIKFLYYLFAY